MGFTGTIPRMDGSFDKVQIYSHSKEKQKQSDMGNDLGNKNLMQCSFLANLIHYNTICNQHLKTTNILQLLKTFESQQHITFEEKKEHPNVAYITLTTV